MRPVSLHLIESPAIGVTPARPLKEIKVPAAGAAILRPAPGVVPVFEGDDPLDLACATCATVLCRGVAPETLAARFSTLVELVLCCPVCHRFNRLPAQVTG